MLELLAVWPGLGAVVAYRVSAALDPISTARSCSHDQNTKHQLDSTTYLDVWDVLKICASLSGERYSIVVTHVCLQGEWGGFLGKMGNSKNRRYDAADLRQWHKLGLGARRLSCL